MTDAERYVLILAGGRGERFWPWSRAERPKQLLPLAGGGRTLLAATLERALALTAPERVIVLTARDLVDAVRRETPAGVRVLGEPVARNTAAAIGATAHLLGGDRAFAVMPADHLIEDRAAFVADLERAFAVARREAVLVTFGIRPSGPETNFGYLRRGTKLGERLYRVAEFCEKPDRARAEQYVRDGGHAWNSGIFVWRAGVFLAALEAARPGLARGLEPLRGKASGARTRTGVSCGRIDRGGLRRARACAQPAHDRRHVRLGRSRLVERLGAPSAPGRARQRRGGQRGADRVRRVRAGGRGQLDHGGPGAQAHDRGARRRRDTGVPARGERPGAKGGRGGARAGGALRGEGAALALLVLGLAAGCAGLAPLRPPASAAAADPAASGAAATGASMPAGTDSAPSSEALAVLGTIPEPLSPAERVPPPAEAAQAARQAGPTNAADTSAAAPADTSAAARADTAAAPPDTASAEVPVPVPTVPLGERQGAAGQALPESVLVPSAPPPPAAAGAKPDTCWRLQIGAPPEQAKAEALQGVASSQLLTAFVIELEKKRYKVRTRDCMERDAVVALRARAQRSGFQGTFVIKSLVKDKKP
jgi:molybdopterin-guanine dinucleotide biosynthesis protein A/cell division septation protein DedD